MPPLCSCWLSNSPVYDRLMPCVFLFSVHCGSSRHFAMMNVEYEGKFADCRTCACTALLSRCMHGTFWKVSSERAIKRPYRFCIISFNSSGYTNIKCHHVYALTCLARWSGLLYQNTRIRTISQYTAHVAKLLLNTKCHDWYPSTHVL